MVLLSTIECRNCNNNNACAFKRLSTRFLLRVFPRPLFPSPLIENYTLNRLSSPN